MHTDGVWQPYCLPPSLYYSGRPCLVYDIPYLDALFHAFHHALHPNPINRIEYVRLSSQFSRTRDLTVLLSGICVYYWTTHYWCTHTSCMLCLRLTRFLYSGGDHLHYHRAFFDIRLLWISRPHPARLTAFTSRHGCRQASLERVWRRIYGTHHPGGVECVSRDVSWDHKYEKLTYQLDGTRSA